MNKKTKEELDEWCIIILTVFIGVLVGIGMLFFSMLWLKYSLYPSLIFSYIICSSISTLFMIYVLKDKINQAG